MADNKTKKTKVSVEPSIGSVAEEGKRADATTLVELMQVATGAERKSISYPSSASIDPVSPILIAGAVIWIVSSGVEVDHAARAGHLFRRRLRRATSDPCQGRDKQALLWYAFRAMKDQNKPDTPPSAPCQPTTDDVVEMYRHAFAAFGSRALWNITKFDQPTMAQVLAITRQLRTEGNMGARRLAGQIEKAARARLQASD